MNLFRLISWPYIRKHGLRCLLTVTGIAVGVAVFVAMHTANAAVFESFQETVKRIAGATELQVSAGEAGFDEEVLERVQSRAEVRVAAPVIEAVVGTGLPGQGNLLILGIDMTGDRSLREYDLESADDALIEDPLVFLAQPDSLMVSSDFARRNGLRLNDKIPLETIEGRREFTVRGILKASGVNSAFGGNIAMMDIYAAQHVFGRGRKFDRIDVAVAGGFEIPAAQAAIQRLLGPGFQVQPPAARGQGFRSLLRIYNFKLRFSSAFALVVGMFIIYNAFSIAVTQRRSEIGVLRALGATRAQISLIFLGESFIGGLAGSLIGILAGHFATGAVARSISGLLEGVYGVSGSDARVELESGRFALYLVLGVATSVVAAMIPARSAARLDPVAALQKGRSQEFSDRESRVRVLLVSLFGATGFALLIFTTSLPFFYAGYVGVLVAAVLLTPMLALWLARGLRPVLRWFLPVEGALAADSLIASPRRTSATVAALMLSLALVIGLGGTARASHDSIAEWVSTALNPDLFVSSSQSLTARSYRFPDSMTAEIEAVEGVEQVQRMRSLRTEYRGELFLLLASELKKLAEKSPRTAVEGNVKEMFRLAESGQGVIASENFAASFKVRVGDSIEIPSPGGLLNLPLVGVIREYSDQQGTLLLDREVFKKYWNDDAVDFFRVYLERGVPIERVKEDILTRFAGNRRVFVLTNHEVRSYVMRLTDQWFAMTWVQISIAILVAILGIVNSLTVSIADRRRELGVLQAVGGFRRQIRRTIWMEAAGIGIVSVILGLALGAIQLYFVLELSARDFPGMRFEYTYPYGVAAALFPIIVVASVLSALGPAESAVRGSLVEALEYE